MKVKLKRENEWIEILFIQIAPLLSLNTKKFV